MKTTIQKNEIRFVMLFAIVVLAAAMTMAADTPPAGNWSVAKTSAGEEMIRITAGGNAVTVAFAAQPQPPSELICDLLVGGATPGSVFHGDLVGLGYSGIRLKLVGTGQQPGDAKVLIRRNLSTDPLRYRTWSYSGLLFAETPGEWMIANVPLRRSAGWTVSGGHKLTGDELDARWADDMGAVESMYVQILSGVAAAQSYSVGDFRLMGPGIISEPANLSALQNYFGVSSLADLTAAEMAALMTRDSDGDGMSDYHELLAGFDPFSRESVFATRMAVTPAGNAITWDGVLGKNYAVWRSTDLRSGFTVLPGAAQLGCAVTGPMTYIDTAPEADAPNFYKVVNY